ncbi:sensor histidine kinase [Natronorubrum daqingense]|nr:ATP-binding protein [Natronorubrum daqingense]APX95646.1 two-component sensor histidine kinase [Natronorubrum daqingense]
MHSREDSLVVSAIDTLPITIAVLDDEGTILQTNRAWSEFATENDLEMHPDTVGTNYLAITAQGETEHARSAATGLSETLSGDREKFELEYPCHSPDERRWFLMRAVSFTEDGERYVAVAHLDITERYEFRHQLEASNERLEQFAYAVSHDLQEPLRMVTSYLELLEQRYAGELDAEADEFIEFAVEGATRMEAMIEGLLTYSRVHTQNTLVQPVDLEAVLDDVRAGLERRIEETEAEIRTDSLPVVEGNASQLRQVFQNLVDNALEYSGGDSPRVTISAERVGDEWIVSVSDEGIGMDPSDADRVFDVFERLHSFEEHEGTGIGLALCRRIVEDHGGAIWIDTEPSTGLTVSCTLPATDQ